MSQERKDQVSDQLFIFGSCVLAALIIWSKFKIPILRFLVENRPLVALIVSSLILCIYLKAKKAFLNSFQKEDFENGILSKSKDEESVFAGYSSKGKRVYIKQSFRRMHTQVIGTTNAGKTESIILPWAIDDIKKGRGLLIMDGKSDRSLLDKLYAYAYRYHRADDVRILSLCNPSISHTFNPLTGGSALEITERVFKAFNFENEYYKNIQYEVLLRLLLIFEKLDITVTPFRLVEALSSSVHLKNLASKSNDADITWVNNFLNLTREEREQRTSGLVTQLQAFSVGDTATIFNQEHSDIDLEQTLSGGHIVYCQLPVLKIPTLGKATGKFILQALQGAVASRHLGDSKSKDFFSVYLDDFTEYLTESFVSLLNKSRSANVAIVFAHQALGDLAGLGEGVKNTILTNANLKVFMRTNEPDSAEYFSGVIGTSESQKVTERQKKSLWGKELTGDGSIRDVEEYKFHPNLFKQELGVGEAVVVLPHSSGSLPVRLKFQKSPDLAPPQILPLAKPDPLPLSSILSRKDELEGEVQQSHASTSKDRLGHITNLNNETTNYKEAS